MQDMAGSKGEERLETGSRGDFRIVHVGTLREFLTGAEPEEIKQGADEGVEQGWEAQWQEFLKTLQAPQPGWTNPRQPQSQLGEDPRKHQPPLAEVGATQGPSREKVTRTLTRLVRGIQDTHEHLDPSVKVKEKPLDAEEKVNEKTEQRDFKQFGNQNSKLLKELLLGPSPKSGQELSSARKTQVFMEARFLAGDKQVRAKQEDNLVLERFEHVELKETLLEKAKGNIFQFHDKEPELWQGAERHVDNHPGKAVEQTFLCEEGDKGLNVNAIQQGIRQIFDLLENPGIPVVDKLHKCSYCGEIAMSREHLIVHERTHVGENPYECSKCGKSFARNSSLVVHRRSHTREKPYEWSECGTGFHCNSYQLAHTRVHNGEKPFKCLCCGKSFAENAALIIHKRNSHRRETVQMPRVWENVYNHL